MVEDNDAAFYMAIKEPKEFRRELLGSTKNLIHLLQRREEIKSIRDNKVEKMKEFSNIMTEIKMLVTKLNKCIPKTKLKNMSKLSQGISIPEAPKKVEKQDHGSVEISKLQSELEEIDKKLGQLE